MTLPRISIIIPVFNDASLLPRCLASIAAQTMQPVEVIVVDDGSEPPFGSGAFATFNSQCSISYIHQPHAGAAAARNTGAAKACGNFLLFCDVDIVLAPHALERLHRALQEHPGAGYAYSAFRFGWKKFASFPFDADRLQRMPYIHTSALIRREHFPGFDPSLKRFQDWDLWLTMLARGHRGVHVAKELFAIKRTRGSMSRWVPAFAHRLPWNTSRVRAYKNAAAIVQHKHHLPLSTSHP